MHVPVLLEEALNMLNVQQGGTYVDGTVGEGGHAAAIMERIGPSGLLIAVDGDSEVLPRAAERLSAVGTWYRLEHADFADLPEILRRLRIEQVDGILLDLGLSSFQLEHADRGFSFQREGPLDMRRDRTRGATAADLLAELDERELEEILRRYGEEPRARRIARRIVEARKRQPIRTTRELAELVEKCVGGRRGRIHPATRTFQALRIAVNRELESLHRALAAAPSLLKRGGRIVVISFHRLEDQAVKTVLGRHVGRWESLPEGGRRWIGERPLMRWVTRKPLTPSSAERAANPRCRSARLRAAERVE